MGGGLKAVSREEGGWVLGERKLMVKKVGMR